MEWLVLRGLLAELLLRHAIGGSQSFSTDYVALLNRLTPFAATTHAPAARKHTNARIASAIALLKGSFADPTLRLQQIASAVGVSPCYLSRLFRRETGERFSTYLRNLRLQEATALLRSPQHSVKEVAWTVGYRHPGHFAFDFRRRFGRTPRAWQYANYRTAIPR